MNNKFLRQKTSISSPTLPRTSDVFSLRPLSSYQFKNRSSNTFELEKQNQERRSYSTSSLWRIINTAKCSEPLNEEIL